MQYVWKNTDQVMLLYSSFQHKKFPWVLCGWGCFCREGSCRSYNNCTGWVPVKLGNTLFESTVHKPQCVLCLQLLFVRVEGSSCRENQETMRELDLCITIFVFPLEPLALFLPHTTLKIFHCMLLPESNSPSASWDIPDRQLRAKILYSGWQDNHFLILKVFWRWRKTPNHI